jgi:hypothetical protein
VTRVVQLFAILWVACIQPPPHATVVIHADRQPTSHAVLVLPTSCITLASFGLCSPSAYGPISAPPAPALAASFADYIDPALRLKLEFAGFTLAEAAAMRLTTADRVDRNGESRVEETTALPRTVAELPIDDVRAIANSLSLTSILVPRLTIHPAEYGQVRGELTVALVDVATNQPRWTVTCTEIMYGVTETPNRLANCAGNGVLAVLAPENLIGRAL